MNKDITTAAAADALFRSAVLGRPVAAVVVLNGSEYTEGGPEFRLRVGTVDYLDREKGYVTLKVAKGYRNTRLSDVLMLTQL